MDYILSIEEVIMSELSTKERNELPASAFGLPEERKFPLIDENHVRSAEAYFHTCPPDKKKELAENIYRAVLRFGMPVNPDDEWYSYIDK